MKINLETGNMLAQAEMAWSETRHNTHYFPDEFVRLIHKGVSDSELLAFVNEYRQLRTTLKEQWYKCMEAALIHWDADDNYKDLRGPRDAMIIRYTEKYKHYEL